MTDTLHYTHQMMDLNPNGRDFVCGDLHGQYDELMELLLQNDFDPSCDRLIALGDLVDRGFDSLKCLRLLREPWFHSLKGNHDEMMEEALAGSKAYWFANGGDWYDRLTAEEKQEVQELCRDYVSHLPISMTLMADSGRTLGLVHAEAPRDWKTAQRGLANQFDMLWGRQRISHRLNGTISNVDAVLVGHSSVNTIDKLGNVYYIDTGAGFKGGKLTVIELSKDIPAFINSMNFKVLNDRSGFNASYELARHDGSPLPGFILEPVNSNPRDKRMFLDDKPPSITLCLDLEATCAKDCGLAQMEMIEIGIIALDENGEEVSRFQSYVQPQFTALTDYCTDITGITQDKLDDAPRLEHMLSSLSEWLKSLPSTPTKYFSWGSYDYRQLEQDFKRLGLSSPMPRHGEAKKQFQKKHLRGKKRVGMKKALSLMGMEFEGKPHSALDDAHNLARLYPHFTSPEKSNPVYHTLLQPSNAGHVYLPLTQTLLDQAGWKIGDRVDYEVKDGAILITKGEADHE